MNSEMEKDILKVLVTEEELKTRIAELGEALYKRYEGHRPLFLGVLKGSFIFMADLMRASQLMCDVEFIAVSSYQNGTVSSGRVQITHDLQQDITGGDCHCGGYSGLRQYPGLPEKLSDGKGCQEHLYRDAAG